MVIWPSGSPTRAGTWGGVPASRPPRIPTRPGTADTAGRLTRLGVFGFNYSCWHPDDFLTPGTNDGLPGAP